MFDLFPRLAERRRQRAATMSGGEQQMLAVGRALMKKPRLLLLDEPTTGLAPKLAARGLRRALGDLRGHGLTIVVAEQQVPLALSIADRGYVLENGRIELDRHGRRAARQPRRPARLPGDRMNRRRGSSTDQREAQTDPPPD